MTTSDFSIVLAVYVGAMLLGLAVWGERYNSWQGWAFFMLFLFLGFYLGNN